MKACFVVGSPFMGSCVMRGSVLLCYFCLVFGDLLECWTTYCTLTLYMSMQVT